MNIRLALAAAACALAFPGAASALTCYMVLDRSDNVIYRDTYPPVDLSDQGAPERERLRRRGEHLIALESDRCPAIEFFTGSAGSPNLQVDQVIAGLPVRSLAGTPADAGQRPAGGPAMAPPSQRAAPARSTAATQKP